MRLYRKKLQTFIYHKEYIRLTTKVRYHRAGFSPGEISLMMDYSEKLNKERRSKIQSEHWVDIAMTIEVAVAEGYDPSLSQEQLDTLNERRLGVTIDQMLEVTGHGKDEADGHGGVLKNWLIGMMQRVDILATDDDQPETRSDERREAEEVDSRRAHLQDLHRGRHLQPALDQLHDRRALARDWPKNGTTWRCRSPTATNRTTNVSSPRSSAAGTTGSMWC